MMELVGRITGNIHLEYIFKPLIMVWISIYFLLNSSNRDFRFPVLIAFFFSWVGDLLLMFSGGYESETLFYAGVGGFLAAQLSYIYVFLKFGENKQPGYLRKDPVLALPLIGYMIGIYLILLPGLEGIMIPVILVYAVALIGMSVAALNRKGRVGHSGYALVFAGSVLFVASDSMIAINKFHTAIPLSGFWIMLTYITAQYLIMRGLILQQPAQSLSETAKK
jgi:uncharacterized membrane protein YhhN